MKSTLNKGQRNLIKALTAALDKPVGDVVRANKSTGGQLLAAAAQFIPGYGQFISPAISMIDGQIDQSKLQPPTPMMRMNNQTMGNYNFGGPLDPPIKALPGVPETSAVNMVNPAFAGIALPSMFSDQMRLSPEVLAAQAGLPAPIDYTRKDSNKSFSRDRVREKATGGTLMNKDFKQYSTGSHASGGDLGVDRNGNPSANPAAFVQNKENSYLIDGQPYVMSDTLRNFETGNLFNKDAAKLNKRYPSADVVTEDKNALDFGMKRLSVINDKMRSIKETVQMACGGSMKKPYGGPLDPLNLFDQQLPYTGVVPYSNAQYRNNDSFIPSASQPFAGLDAPIEEGLAMDTTNPMSAPVLNLGPDLNATSPSPNRSYSGSRASASTGRSNGDFNFNNAALLLKGVALGKSVVDAFTPSEVEQPILPNYQKSDQQMLAANIDFTQAKQDALGVANMAGASNRAASSNYGQFNNRQGATFANLSDTIGRISSQENAARSQLNLQQGQYEQGKAVDTANRLYQNRVDNLMNQANTDFADQKLFQELSQIGTEMNKAQYTRDMIKNNRELANAKIQEGLLLIGSQTANFGFSADFIERLKSGKASLDETVKFISTTEQLKKG